MHASIEQSTALSRRPMHVVLGLSCRVGSTQLINGLFVGHMGHSCTTCVEVHCKCPAGNLVHFGDAIA